MQRSTPPERHELLERLLRRENKMTPAGIRLAPVALQGALQRYNAVCPSYPKLKPVAAGFHLTLSVGEL